MYTSVETSAVVIQCGFCAKTDLTINKCLCHFVILQKTVKNSLKMV